MKKNIKRITKALGISENRIKKTASKSEKKAMEDMKTGKIKNMEDIREKYKVTSFTVLCKLASMETTWKRKEEKKRSDNSEVR